MWCVCGKSMVDGIVYMWEGCVFKGRRMYVWVCEMKVCVCVWEGVYRRVCVLGVCGVCKRVSVVCMLWVCRRVCVV